MKYFIFSALAVLLIFNIAQAHVAGISFEKDVGEYLLDIGAQQETIEAGVKTDFDFALFKDEITHDFEDVFVEFTKGDNVVFSSRLVNPKIGRATLKIVFPEAGTYNMEVSFLDNEKTIVDNVYEFEVQGGSDSKTEESSTQGIVVGIIIGFIVGVVVVSLFRKKKVV